MDVEQTVRELLLRLQVLEDRVEKLEKGEFGTGIYLDGCSEATVEYIKSSEQKAGE